jgi:serine phosphatase RsbU (regulator of sigma subunit)
MSIKQRVYDLIRDDGQRSLANRIFSTAITVLIIINIATVLLDLLDVFSADAQAVIFYIEVVAVAVFTVEYILRLWTANLLFSNVNPIKARGKYIFSPMALVDLIAIVPFYLPYVFPINMTILRLLRLLRLMRILKLNRFSDAKTSEVILSSIKESIVLLDAQHNFLSANDSAKKQFPSLANFKKFTPITSAEDWPEELMLFDEKDEKNIADSILFNTNNERFYNAHISPIYDKEKLLRCVVIIQDITEKYLFEQAEKERAQAELAYAASIQTSMLPSVVPPFSNHAAFDISALMHPAREVGGDFYDFFFIDENKLAVIIGDVSGKSIPAAMFMVKAQTQLKNATQSGAPLPEVMEKVNNLMCENNYECMFVTIFLGVLDIPTGRFSYVNGGHDVPLIKQGEKFNWLPTNPGKMPGFMENTKYVQDEIILQKGDTLFLYTDGVTEAENPNQEALGEELLKSLINQCKFNSAENLLTIAREEITAFADGAEQFDDITMLALTIKE